MNAVSVNYRYEYLQFTKETAFRCEIITVDVLEL